ncbi:protein roadkill-like [Phymastichus coffea]|uniref:protein roadkill-like n=1 Tax=Phymastichus coffea TaxID=108790 RepID=UPI00273BFDFB|nr:protein roadkill-like [Phymastichus coffea]
MNVNVCNGDLESSSTFTIKWKVKQFTAYFEGNRNDLNSPELLTVYANNVLHWRLRLSKNYDREGYRSYMAVYLDYLDEFPMTASVIFAILSSRRERVFQRVTKAKFDKNLHFCGIIDFVQQNLITDGSMNLLMNDSLIITCEIRFQDSMLCAKFSRLGLGEKSTSQDGVGAPNRNIKSTAITSASHATVNLNAELKALSDDMEKLLESEIYSDVSFIIGEKKIRAHKNILTTRSQVFEQLFANHETAEKKRSLVGVKDVRYEAMREMLRFIYTGKVNDLDKMPVELLKAAEKYALPGLKAIVEKTLAQKIKFENALEYLNLAKTYNASVLNARAMDCVINRLGDYVNTPEFRDLSVEIKDDLLSAVSKKKIP